jgi:MSHA biogenesis protein MshO
MRRTPTHARGFTLVEMIIVMTIMGILTAMVAVFIAAPVEGYVDTVRRSQLTDTADLALKRIALELRTAVPNTVRVTASSVEFIPTTGGGRYCTDRDTGCTALTHFDPYDATADAITFTALGPPPTIAVGDYIIIYNTGQSANGPGEVSLSAYNVDNNCARVTAWAASNVSYNNVAFPQASPGSRFHVAPASGPVRFSCTGGQLVRIQGSVNFCGVAPVPAQTTAVLAANVNCAASSFTYNNVSAANGLVTATIALTADGETVTLRQQVHVDNLP